MRRAGCQNKRENWGLILLPLLVVILLISMSCFGETKTHVFDFQNDSMGWGSWGEGDYRHVAGLGHARGGALELSCATDQQQTLHQHFALPPGRYKVSGWLRALDVLPGKWNYAIWLFYQTGADIVSPVTGLHGTFNWSKFEYTIEVAEKGVDIWFRLKSPGAIWLDDISVAPYSGEPVSFDFTKSSQPLPHTNPLGVGVRCPGCYRWVASDTHFCPICGNEIVRSDTGGKAEQHVEETRLLLDFEPASREGERRRFKLGKITGSRSTHGHHSAVILYGKYNSLNLADAKMYDWRGYDYISLDVYSPVDDLVRFALSVGDQDGGGYWNQLNHYSTLTHGWNRLRFRVNRYVGERGSVRVKRYLDLGHIKRAWFAVEPEKKREYLGDFLVDNIRLEKAPPPPASFDGLYLFDFVKERFRAQPGFLAVDGGVRYSDDVGFGFIDTTVWRAHDSLYADSLYRDGIFVNSGSFRVDLPNGRYTVRLVPFGLGEWYEHFWTRRKILIQGRKVLDEKRHSAGEYLGDFLRFSEVEPGPQDNAYDLYLRKIFQEIVSEVEVRDGKLVIEFDGDDSGVMLNSLIIYPEDKKQQGDKFMTQLGKVQKAEFDDLCRRVESEPLSAGAAILAEEDWTRGYYSALIDVDVQLRHNQILDSLGESIDLTGMSGQRPVQALLVRNLREKSMLKATLAPLQSADGAMLTPGRDWLRYGVAQFQSHSFNHETYELAPRFLREFPVSGLGLEKDYSLLLWLQIPVSKGMAAGTYRSVLTLQMHGRKVAYPVSLEIKSGVLPEADFAIGFFGLDPVPFSYFDERNTKETRKTYRYEMLRALRERGFTTWSGLPGSTFLRQGDRWDLRAADVDELMQMAQQLGFAHKIFTYGGEPLLELDAKQSISGVSAAEYWHGTGKSLQEHMERFSWLPLVVDLSDEAAGYSQTVVRDSKRAQMLREYYPYLRRGGYSHPIKKGDPGYDLNLMLTDISLSKTNEGYLKLLAEKGIRWGVYNQASGLFTNNRLFVRDNLSALRAEGCDHYLEWHGTLAQNYPYYDLDGREHDAMMFFPRKDGGLDYALKFEWAALGLEEYRLQLLDHQQKSLSR